MYIHERTFEVLSTLSEQVWAIYALLVYFMLMVVNFGILYRRGYAWQVRLSTLYFIFVSVFFDVPRAVSQIQFLNK